LKSLRSREFFKRRQLNKNDIERLLSKSFQANSLVPVKFKTTSIKSLHRLRFFSVSRIKNRCQIANRGRSIYRLFKVSRLEFKKSASFGRFCGVKRASW